MKLLNPRILVFCVVFSLAGFFLSGCGDNDPAVPSSKLGTILINIFPDSLDAPWELNGPQNFNLVGNGDQTIQDLRLGLYEISWSAIPGFLTPADSTLSLTNGITSTFTGTYELDTIIHYPSNPDILVQNLERVYSQMLIDDFREMLHQNYKTILSPSTLEEWEQGGNPLPEDFFDRDGELQIHANMFSGHTGLDANGVTVPGIDSIRVDYIQKVGSWEPIPDSDENFAGEGGYWAHFNVLIYFNNPNQHRFEVRQDVVFYVVPVDDDDRTKWLLLGQSSQGPPAKATESCTFDGLKSLYRNS